MRMPWHGRPVPDDARRVLSLSGGERVLDWTNDTAGTVLVAGSARLYAVTGGRLALARPWHLVDSGRWNRESSSLTVTWVDGERRCRWVIEDGTSFLQAVRERVQASVVLSEDVSLGERGSARVVIRRDLESGSLLGQTVLGRGVGIDDPGVRETTEAVLGYLKEQVGLL